MNELLCYVKSLKIMYLNIILDCSTAEIPVNALNPVVVAAIIGAIVSLPGFILNFQNYISQRNKSKRDEIYKKLNSFYGPMRLQLKTSSELYELFSSSIMQRLNLNEFHTLPFILDGNELNKTERTLLEQILKIGKAIEKLIDNNAGLIDDDDLHEEMVQLATHLRIIREAKNGGYSTGTDKLTLLESKTFPKPEKLEERVDQMFWKLKKKLKK